MCISIYICTNIGSEIILHVYLHTPSIDVECVDKSRGDDGGDHTAGGSLCPRTTI